MLRRSGEKLVSFRTFQQCADFGYRARLEWRARKCWRFTKVCAATFAALASGSINHRATVCQSALSAISHVAKHGLSALCKQWLAGRYSSTYPTARASSARSALHRNNYVWKHAIIAQPIDAGQCLLSVHGARNMLVNRTALVSFDSIRLFHLHSHAPLASRAEASSAK